MRYKRATNFELRESTCSHPRCSVPTSLWQSTPISSSSPLGPFSWYRLDPPLPTFRGSGRIITAKTAKTRHRPAQPDVVHPLRSTTPEHRWPSITACTTHSTRSSNLSRAGSFALYRKNPTGVTKYGENLITSLIFASPAPSLHQSPHGASQCIDRPFLSYQLRSIIGVQSKLDRDRTKLLPPAYNYNQHRTTPPSPTPDPQLPLPHPSRSWGDSASTSTSGTVGFCRTKTRTVIDSAGWKGHFHFAVESLSLMLRLFLELGRALSQYLQTISHTSSSHSSRRSSTILPIRSLPPL